MNKIQNTKKSDHGNQKFIFAKDIIGCTNSIV